MELCPPPCDTAGFPIAFALVGNHATYPPMHCILNPAKEPDVSILASSLALGSADYTWRDGAICRDTDPELFFPIGTTGQALLQISRAKSVCSECPVSVDCLEFAIETNQDTGIWGGTSEEERRQLRRDIASQRRISRAG